MGVKEMRKAKRERRKEKEKDRGREVERTEGQYSPLRMV